MDKFCWESSLQLITKTKDKQNSTTQLLSLTQENEDDPHRVGRDPQHSRRWSGQNTHILPKTQVSTIWWPTTFFPLVANATCFVCNEPKVKMTHSSNHTKHYGKQLYISGARSTTALQPNVLTVTHRTLTNKHVQLFHRANCQGQLQTPQSVPVLPL